MKWISIFDSLPGVCERVLVTDGKEILIGYIGGSGVGGGPAHPAKGWLFITVKGITNDFDISYWMPLPDLPKLYFAPYKPHQERSDNVT